MITTFKPDYIIAESGFPALEYGRYRSQMTFDEDWYRNKWRIGSKDKKTARLLPLRPTLNDSILIMLSDRIADSAQQLKQQKNVKNAVTRCRRSSFVSQSKEAKIYTTKEIDYEGF